MKICAMVQKNGKMAQNAGIWGYAPPGAGGGKAGYFGKISRKRRNDGYENKSF